MSLTLDAQIADVRVQVSIFHKDGYRTVDLDLLNETMTILGAEEDDLVSEWSGPDHCDAYLMLNYETWADAHDNALADTERLRARATEVYADCARRKELRETVIQPLYDAVDARGVAIENREVTPKPGEYKSICDEQERLQGLLDSLAPYEFDDSRDLADVLSAFEHVSVTGAA